MNETAHVTTATDVKRQVRRMLFLPFLLLFIITFSAIQPSRCFAAESEAAARVNGVAITVAELGRAIESSRNPGSFHGKTGNKEEHRKYALDRLIDWELLFQEAGRSGLTIDDGDIDKVVKEAAGRFKKKTEFEVTLKKSGMDLKEYRERIRKNETSKKIFRIEVVEKSSCSDKDLEAYYSANKGKFVGPEGFGIRQYLLKVPPAATDKERAEIKDKGEALLKKVKGGEEVTWGDIVWISEGGDEPALVAAALNLTVGETSGLIPDIYGFHILKLEEKKPAELRTFAEVKDSLKKELESKKYKELSDALLMPLREKAKIEIY